MSSQDLVPVQSELASVNPAVDESIWDKVAREASLGGAAISGIGESFAELKDNPTEALVEFGSAAAIVGGLTLASRGGIFVSSLGRIAGAAMGVAFLKSLAESGIASGKAIADTWNSPNNMEHNKEVIGQTAGTLAVDLTAFTLGGMAGSRLAGRISGFGPFAREKTTFSRDGAYNFAEDPILAASREASIGNPTAVRENLQSLLGGRQLQQPGKGAFAVQTRFGEATLSPYYSRENASLQIFFDSPKSINPRWMEVYLNGQGNPGRIAVLNDQAHFVPSLFREMGLKDLAQATGKPTEFTIADAFRRIDYRPTNAEWARIKSSAAEPVTMMYHGKPPLYVRQKTGESAPITTPLGTTGMGPCSALIVIDRAGGRHFLAHVDHVSNPELLRSGLRSFDLKNSEIYIMEGPGNPAGTSPQMLGSAQRALMAVAHEPGIAQRVKYLEYALPTSNANVVIHNGKIYAGAERYSGLD